MKTHVTPFLTNSLNIWHLTLKSFSGVKSFLCKFAQWISRYIESTLGVTGYRLTFLTPMSDQDRISPYNINMTSSRQVMGKQKMSMRVSLKIWLDSKLTAVKKKPRLGECTAASSLCLCQHPPEVSHCSRNRISVRKAQESSGKGLNCITNDAFLLSKYDGTYNW